jgi:hypothetical protein
LGISRVGILHELVVSVRPSRAVLDHLFCPQEVQVGIKSGNSRYNDGNIIHHRKMGWRVNSTMNKKIVVLIACAVVFTGLAVSGILYFLLRGDADDGAEIPVWSPPIFVVDPWEPEPNEDPIEDIPWAWINLPNNAMISTIEGRDLVLRPQGYRIGVTQGLDYRVYYDYMENRLAFDIYNFGAQFIAFDSIVVLADEGGDIIHAFYVHSLLNPPIGNSNYFYSEPVISLGRIEYTGVISAYEFERFQQILEIVDYTYFGYFDVEEVSMIDIREFAINHQPIPRVPEFTWERLISHGMWYHSQNPLIPPRDYIFALNREVVTDDVLDELLSEFFLHNERWNERQYMMFVMQQAMFIPNGLRIVPDPNRIRDPDEIPRPDPTPPPPMGQGLNQFQPGTPFDPGGIVDAPRSDTDSAGLVDLRTSPQIPISGVVFSGFTFNEHTNQVQVLVNNVHRELTFLTTRLELYDEDWVMLTAINMGPSIPALGEEQETWLPTSVDLRNARFVRVVER